MGRVTTYECDRCGADGKNKQDSNVPVGWAEVTIEERIPDGKMLVRNSETESDYRLINSDDFDDDSDDEEVEEIKLIVCADCVRQIKNRR